MIFFDLLYIKLRKHNFCNIQYKHEQQAINFCMIPSDLKLPDVLRNFVFQKRTFYQFSEIKTTRRGIEKYH